MQYFTQQLLKNRPQLAFQWQSTDPDPQCLDSLVARRNELISSLSPSAILTEDAATAVDEGASSCALQEPLPLTLDANGICERSTDKKQQQQYYDLIVNINMIHISPWEATLGLFKVAGERLLAQQHHGILFLYGPYKVNGTCVESNRYVEYCTPVRRQVMQCFSHDHDCMLSLLFFLYASRNFDESLKARDARFGVRNLEDVMAVAKRNGLELVVPPIEMPANNLSLIFQKRK